MPHAGLDDPHLATLSLVLAKLGAADALALNIDDLEPALAEMVVNGGTHDLDVWEHLAEHDNAAEACDEECHEDDVVLRHAVVEQYTNRHERGCGGPNLRVEQEDVCVVCALTIADALRESEVEEQWLAGLGLGLDEQRANRDIVHYSA